MEADALGSVSTFMEPEFDRSLLNPFSLGFARALFAAHPEWQPFAVPWESGFRLEVSPPSAGRERLGIFTSSDEITIRFSQFHTHFGWSDVPDERT